MILRAVDPGVSDSIVSAPHGRTDMISAETPFAYAGPAARWRASHSPDTRMIDPRL